MYKKGSITIYLSLMLVVLLSLITAALYSAELACTRLQAVHKTDQGIYSLFARYDKNLLSRYKVFFVDGSFGGESLDCGRIYQMMKRDIQDVSGSPSRVETELKTGNISAYTLATDNGGNALKSQAVSYMETLLGIQSVRTIVEKVQQEEETIRFLEQERGRIDQENEMEIYEDVKAQGEGNQWMSGDFSEEETELPEQDPQDQIMVPDDYENPVETIKELRSKGILELVLDEEDEISTVFSDRNSMVSGRNLEHGLGTPIYDENCNGGTKEILFNEYLARHMGCYTDIKNTAGLKYQLEYILHGKEDDIENLKSTANRLMVIREAANLCYLYSDSGKRSQAKAAALLLAVVLLMPEAAESLEPVILICWAFGESILDVRSLLKGEKVPLTKDTETWQISITDLPKIVEGLDGFRKTYDRGMSYQDYIKCMMLLKSSDEKIRRCMDMVEQGINGEEGREGFKLDHCIFGIETELFYETRSDMTYSVSRRYGYYTK